jgi:hypothetical protein
VSALREKLEDAGGNAVTTTLTIADKFLTWLNDYKDYEAIQDDNQISGPDPISGPNHKAQPQAQPHAQPHQPAPSIPRRNIWSEQVRQRIREIQLKRSLPVTDTSKMNDGEATQLLNDLIDNERKRNQRQRSTHNFSKKFRELSPEEKEKVSDAISYTLADPICFRELNDTEIDIYEKNPGGWCQRPAGSFGNAPGDPYVISSKQFGYLIGLSKRYSVELDAKYLNGLSNVGASYLIDILTSLNGNSH